MNRMMFGDNFLHIRSPQQVVFSVSLGRVFKSRTTKPVHLGPATINWGGFYVGGIALQSPGSGFCHCATEKGYYQFNGVNATMLCGGKNDSYTFNRLHYWTRLTPSDVEVFYDPC